MKDEDVRGPTELIEHKHMDEDQMKTAAGEVYRESLRKYQMQRWVGVPWAWAVRFPLFSQLGITVMLWYFSSGNVYLYNPCVISLSLLMC